MRAFRPSYFAPAEDYDEDHQPDKEANLELYAERAEAGVPLFDRAAPPGKPTPDSPQFLTGK